MAGLFAACAAPSCSSSSSLVVVVLPEVVGTQDPPQRRERELAGAPAFTALGSYSSPLPTGTG